MQQQQNTAAANAAAAAAADGRLCDVLFNQRNTCLMSSVSQQGERSQARLCGTSRCKRNWVGALVQRSKSAAAATTKAAAATAAAATTTATAATTIATAEAAAATAASAAKAAAAKAAEAATAAAAKAAAATAAAATAAAGTAAAAPAAFVSRDSELICWVCVLSDVKQQINQNLKKALEIKTREAEAAKSFLLQAEALLRPFTQGNSELPGCTRRRPGTTATRVSTPQHQQQQQQQQQQQAGLPPETPTLALAIAAPAPAPAAPAAPAVAAVAAAAAAAAAAATAASAAGYWMFCLSCFDLACSCCSADGRQQLLREKQRLEARLEEANGALRKAQAERLRLEEAEGQRDAFRIQAEAQQQSLEQQALLIDGLKQRCISLEAEKRELSCAQSTTAEGSGSSFRSLFFSWGPQEGPRQRRGLEEGGDVLSYTLADGLEAAVGGDSAALAAAAAAALAAAAVVLAAAVLVRVCSSLPLGVAGVAAAADVAATQAAGVAAAGSDVTSNEA
ncbi:hypothetical protein Emag_006987 [Eimeria magna]